MTEIEKTIEAVGELDLAAVKLCQQRQDNLIKPAGSLGALEELSLKLAGISQNPRPEHPQKTLVIAMADHGIAREEGGVKCLAGKEFALRAAQGSGIINRFVRHAGADLILADAGLWGGAIDEPGILEHKVKNGADNIKVGAAMSRDEAVQLIKSGINLAAREISRGTGLIGIGSVGAGGDISAAAIVAVCAGVDAFSLTGGKIDERQAEDIQTALKINQPDPDDALDILSKLGGLETAFLTGVILGAARGRAAIVLDSGPSLGAALVAAKLAPRVKNFMTGSLRTTEPYRHEALKMLEVCAYIDPGAELGPGLGAVLGMSLVKAALHVLNDMKTFAETGVTVAQDGFGKSKQRND